MRCSLYLVIAAECERCDVLLIILQLQNGQTRQKRSQDDHKVQNAVRSQNAFWFDIIMLNNTQ